MSGGADWTPERWAKATGFRWQADVAALTRLAALVESPLEALSLTLVSSQLTTRQIALQVRLTGRAQRVCGVSLEPFIAPIQETLDWRWWREPTAAPLSAAAAPRKAVMLHEDDLIDPWPAAGLEPEALARDMLVLIWDPHPRKPDALLPPELAPPQEPRAIHRPFAALAALKSSAPKPG